ncbi:MAG: hypothetical protein JWP87_5388 [Labilithrix sp.]|nr:hypothetical protein [Labilithrix sp.]
MRAFTYGVGRNAAIVLVALGTVACTALLGDFSVGGGDGTSGGPGEGGTEGGSDAEGALTITPAEVKVGVLRAQTFTVNLPVTWSIQEGASAGIIDDAGKFLAPDKPGVVHVVATSKSDPAVKATATVTVAPVGISILAGGNGGEGNIDGPPLKAHFKNPAGIAHLFPQGGGSGDRYFISDSGNHTIRQYDTATQKVTTIAGTPGTQGHSDGKGAAASFLSPRAMVADRKRNVIYIVDSDGTCIRELDPATAMVTTISGTCGTTGASDGGPSAPATYSFIRSFDVNGGKFFGEDVTALYICDGASRIRKLSLAGMNKGTTTTLLNTSGCDLATDLVSGSPKSIYYIDKQELRRIQDVPPYTPTPLGPAPEFYTNGMGVASGQGPAAAVFALSESHSVVYHAQLGQPFDTTAIVGATDDAKVLDGPFTSARLGRPSAIDVITERGNGSFLFADYESDAIRIADLGQKKVSTLVGAARMLDRVDGPRSAARLSGPFAVASDTTGVYFTDVAFDGPVLNNTIRKVDPAGVVSSIAGKPGRPSTTVAPLDGSKDEATFGFPIDLMILKGNIYVIDAFGQAVRKVTLAGDVTTLAGELGVAGDATDAVGAAAHFKFADTSSSGGGGFGGGIATDGTDIFVADTSNFAIRKINATTGQVTLLAGGSSGSANGIGKAAQFVAPFGLAYDSGFLYIADAGDHTIRRLDLKTNEVTGLMGLSGLFGQIDGDAAKATFHSPGRIAADGLGNLFVAEIPFNDNFFPGVIRRIAIKSRTVSSYAGTKGAMGLATGPLPSTVNCPVAFTVTPAGDLAFADFCEASIALLKPL